MHIVSTACMQMIASVCWNCAALRDLYHITSCMSQHSMTTKGQRAKFTLSSLAVSKSCRAIVSATVHRLHGVSHNMPACLTIVGAVYMLIRIHQQDMLLATCTLLLIRACNRVTLIRMCQPILIGICSKAQASSSDLLW